MTKALPTFPVGANGAVSRLTVRFDDGITEPSTYDATLSDLSALLAALSPEQRERVFNALPPEAWLAAPGTPTYHDELRESRRMLEEAVRERDAYRAEVQAVGLWIHEHGAALSPESAATLGRMMRVAGAAVRQAPAHQEPE